MIERLNCLEMFGKSDGVLSERSETYFGALVYMLACGYVSNDHCWAESGGAHAAVKNTLKYMYQKFPDISADTILYEFNTVCRMVAYNVVITDYTMFKRCPSRIDCHMEDIRSLYDTDPAFKSFITRVKNVISARGDFSEYAKASLCEIRDIVLHANCGIDNFIDIILNFLDERDSSIEKNDRVSGLIRANFVPVSA